jgi:MFS transporter, DHA3 family, macrolide efflux protein
MYNLKIIKVKFQYSVIFIKKIEVYMQNQSQAIQSKWAPRFFTIWTGQAFSLFGSQLVQFALIWWLAQKSGSATILAIATLVGMLPQILFGPFAGALVDRWNRRMILIIADSSIAVFTLLLAWLFVTGRVQIWHVYAIMAVRSLGTAFHFPLWPPLPRLWCRKNISRALVD